MFVNERREEEEDVTWSWAKEKNNMSLVETRPGKRIEVGWVQLGLG